MADFNFNVILVAGFDLSTSGLLSVLPYACNFLAVIASGHFFDYLQVLLLEFIMFWKNSADVKYFSLCHSANDLGRIEM